MASPEDFNPYAAPLTTASADAFADRITIDGPCLVIPKKFILPPICLKTGATENLTPLRRKKVAWYPPLLALLIIFNLFVFLLIAACVSKRGVFYYYLSRETARKRSGVILRNWGFLALSIILTVLAVWLRSFELGTAAVVGYVVTIVGSMFATQFLYAKRVDKTHIWLCSVPEHVARQLVRTDPAPIAPAPVLPMSEFSQSATSQGSYDY